MSKDIDELTKLNKHYLDFPPGFRCQTLRPNSADYFYCTLPDMSFVDRARISQIHGDSGQTEESHRAGCQDLR